MSTPRSTSYGKTQRVDPKASAKSSPRRKSQGMKLSWWPAHNAAIKQEYIETIQRSDGRNRRDHGVAAYWCGGLPFAYERKPEWNDLEYRIRNWLRPVLGRRRQHRRAARAHLDVCNWVMNAHPIRVFAMAAVVETEGRKYATLRPLRCYEYGKWRAHAQFQPSWQGCAEGVMKSRRNQGTQQLHEPGKGHKRQIRNIDLLKSIRGEGVPQRRRPGCRSPMTGSWADGAYTAKCSLEQGADTDLKLVPEVLDFSKPYPLAPVPAPRTGPKVIRVRYRFRFRVHPSPSSFTLSHPYTLYTLTP